MVLLENLTAAIFLDYIKNSKPERHREILCEIRKICRYLKRDLFELSLRFTSNVDIQFYIVWALKFIANNQDDTDAVHTKSVIGRIKQNLDKEDIEKIEVEGAMKFYKDENGEPLFKDINIGGRIYLNDGDVL